MRIGICDDVLEELAVTERLCRSYIEECGIDAEIISSVCWQEIAGTDMDLLILDIEMPDMNGIQIKEMLEQNEGPLILFVTGYDDYMMQAFGKNVMGYVQKPVKESDFRWYLEKIIRILTAGKNVTLGGGRVVSTERIRMIAADNRYTRIAYDKAGGGELSDKSLSAWEEELSDVYFLRISQSVLVNCKFVMDFEGDEAIMDDGSRLPVSRRKKKSCYERFMTYNRKYAAPR